MSIKTETFGNMSCEQQLNWLKNILHHVLIQINAKKIVKITRQAFNDFKIL